MLLPKAIIDRTDHDVNEIIPVPLKRMALSFFEHISIIWKNPKRRLKNSGDHHRKVGTVKTVAH